MDNVKIGRLIKELRLKKGLTQAALASELNISDKAVSKWERGWALPDVSLFPLIADILGVDISALLLGSIDENESNGGNMKKTKFYVCPECGNVITALEGASVSCCSRKLEELEMRKALDEEKLKVDKVDDELFIESDHEMSKENYISFVAFLTGEAVFLRKLYPEWNLQIRIPSFSRHGNLVWYSAKEGLLYQLI